MPNRIIKETICTSDNLNSLSPEEEVFFYRLIVNCDDYGVADGRAAIVRAKCFPLKLDKYSEYQIEEWLEKLQTANLIFMYEVDGRRYLKMTSWENHQQIRAKKSKFPLPDSKNMNMISNDINGNQIQADDDKCPRNPIQSESNPNPTPAVDENVKRIQKLFRDCNMGEINGMIAETVFQIADEYPMELVEEAFRLAGLKNAKSISYPHKILQSWKAKGITTLDGVKFERKEKNKEPEHSYFKKLPEKYDYGD